MGQLFSLLLCTFSSMRRILWLLALAHWTLVVLQAVFLLGFFPVRQPLEGRAALNGLPNWPKGANYSEKSVR